MLGETIGQTDARELRRRIGYVSAALAAEIDPALPAIDVVMTARHAALAPWWADFDAGRSGASGRRPGPAGAGRLRSADVREPVVRRAAAGS